jgi:hypothetical protein
MINKFDLASHIEDQKEFSLKTFGPGERTLGIIDHIRKELAEIRSEPSDLEEWIDVISLALDGSWRAGFTSKEIVNSIEFDINLYLKAESNIESIISSIEYDLGRLENHPKALGIWALIAKKAIGGAYSNNFPIRRVLECLTAKLEKNKKRDWPDWRKADPDSVIEHIK